MCQKKPGPRCSSHLSQQIAQSAAHLESLQTSLPETVQQREALANLLGQRYALQEQARKDLMEEGNESPSTEEVSDRARRTRSEILGKIENLYKEEDSLRKHIEAEKIRKRDLGERFLGTKKGQERAARRVAELKEQGNTQAAFRLNADALNARDLHKKSLAYAKWAQEVREGRFPGRLVPSEDTSGSVYVRHSGDPLYDASREELASLSNADLERISSGRYGNFALTPATTEKISDERERRRVEAEGGGSSQSVKENFPEAWKTVKETSYGDNYFSTVWSRDSRAEGYAITNLHETITKVTTRVWDNNERKYKGTISYPEALSKAVGKTQFSVSGKRGPEKVTMLVLDDGRNVQVDSKVANALRFNKATGLHKGI